MPTSFSLLRYPGGKAWFAPYLANLASTHALTDFAYCEPFAGSSAAALHLLFTGHASRLILSDKDANVAAFWRLVLDEPALVEDFIRDVPLNMTEWHQQRALFLDADAKPEQRALAFFFLNRTNRSGLILSGPIGGKEQTGPYALDARFNRESLIARLYRISLLRESIEFHEADVFQAIDRLKKRRCYKERSVWMYLDPPYYGWGDNLYLCKFSRSEHERLARRLRRERDLPWVLSYDDTVDVRESYKNLELAEVDVNYFMHTHREARELVLSNLPQCRAESRTLTAVVASNERRLQERHHPRAG